VTAEPADGTVLVWRVAGAYRVIVRDDGSGGIRGRRWFDAADPQAPMTWREILRHADQLYLLGAPLLAEPGAPATPPALGQ